MRNLDRREFLTAVCGGAISLKNVAAAPKKPLNFVFFLIDDLGWTDAACYGSKYYETPNIDRLTKQGMKFTNAYAACPLCSPTRAAVLTGKSPARLHLTTALPGVVRPKPNERLLAVKSPAGLATEEVTIAEALKPAGYVSASVGKWHLGAAEYLPEKQGFDLNVGGTQAGMPPSYFYPRWKGKPGGKGLMSGVPIPDGQPGEYLTDRLTSEAIKFIEANKDKPFFLYLPHFAVHTFLEGKEDLVEKYRRKADPNNPQQNPVYAAMIESVDDSVGKIVAKLDELGIAGRTVVFFTGDNGGANNVQTYTKDPLPPTSNLPLRAGKATLYEGGIRVPLIVRGPSVKAGAVSDVPVISHDFFPSILEMAGLKPDPKNPLDGMSIVPALKGGKTLSREALYWYFPHNDHLILPGGAVRYRNYKLIEYMEDGRLELYNLESDLGEQHDLAKQMPEKAAELKAMLHRWLKSVNAEPMLPNPAYKTPGVGGLY